MLQQQQAAEFYMQQQMMYQQAMYAQQAEAYAMGSAPGEGREKGKRGRDGKGRGEKGEKGGKGRDKGSGREKGKGKNSDSGKGGEKGKEEEPEWTDSPEIWPELGGSKSSSSKTREVKKWGPDNKDVEQAWKPKGQASAVKTYDAPGGKVWRPKSSDEAADNDAPKNSEANMQRPSKGRGKAAKGELIVGNAEAWPSLPTASPQNKRSMATTPQDVSSQSMQTGNSNMRQYSPAYIIEVCRKIKEISMPAGFLKAGDEPRKILRTEPYQDFEAEKPTLGSTSVPELSPSHLP